MSDIPDSIIVWALNCINGEITQNMRMICFSYTMDEAKFLIYLDVEPIEDDFERAEIIAVNFDAGLPKKLKSLDVNVVHSTEALSVVEGLDVTLFRRCEAVGI